MIDYSTKLATAREVNPIDNLDYFIESDRGRIFEMFLRDQRDSSLL